MANLAVKTLLSEAPGSHRSPRCQPPMKLVARVQIILNRTRNGRRWSQQQQKHERWSLSCPPLVLWYPMISYDVPILVSFVEMLPFCWGNLYRPDTPRRARSPGVPLRRPVGIPQPGTRGPGNVAPLRQQNVSCVDDLPRKMVIFPIW